MCRKMTWWISNDFNTDNRLWDDFLQFETWSAGKNPLFRGWESAERPAKVGHSLGTKSFAMLCSLHGWSNREVEFQEISRNFKKYHDISIHICIYLYLSIFKIYTISLVCSAVVNGPHWFVSFRSLSAQDCLKSLTAGQCVFGSAFVY